MSVMPFKSFCVEVLEHMDSNICRSNSGLTPCSYSIVDSWRVAMDDRLSLEGPAVDQLQLLLTPPEVIH